MKRKSKCENDFVAPDGGWGYMNVVAVVINLVIITTFNNNHGMLFKDLFAQLNMSSASVACLNGVSSISYAVSGFITSPLLKLVSIRKLALIASTALSFGQFSTVFLHSKALLFICQGLIQGFGTGVLVNLSFTVITQYFDKKRLLVVSIVQTSTALSVLVAPKLVKWCLEMYGVRGTILFLSSVTMNTILGAVLMQPVSWHRRKVVKSYRFGNSRWQLVSQSCGFWDIEIPAYAYMCFICGIAIKVKKMKLLTENDSKINQLPLTEFNNTLNNPETGNEDGNQGDIKLNMKKNGINKIFGDFTDVIIRKKFILSIAPLGLSLAGFADGTFIIMLPKALHYMDWNTADITWAMYLQVFGDLITKITFILANKWLNKFGTHELYVGGLVIALFTRIGMLWSDNKTVMLIFLTAMGISRCTIVLLAPLVIAESVGPEKFSAAMGIVMLLFGVFNIVLAPVIDAVRVLTDSYSTALYILASFYGIVIMFWCIELLYKKNKHKWVIRKEGAKMNN